MTELVIDRKFGGLKETRDEMVEILNSPEELFKLKGYFNDNKNIVNGKEYYGCNGYHCDSKLARIFAMLKYIAQPCEYSGLDCNCSNIELISIQNSYYYRYQLPTEEIQFVEEDDAPSFKILISGNSFQESKRNRINDLGLENFIIVLDPEE